MRCNNNRSHSEPSKEETTQTIDAQNSSRVGLLYKERCKMQVDMQDVGKPSNKQAQVKCLTHLSCLEYVRTLLMLRDVKARAGFWARKPTLVLETTVG